MKRKVDGVIEAVHYDHDGKIKWVRMYERHGLVYADAKLFDRQELLKMIRDGKAIFGGKRKPGLGSVFELITEKPLQIEKSGNEEVITTGEQHPSKDLINAVPMF